MKFRERLERLKAGEATGEEAELIRCEIDKYEAIGDYLAEQFEEILPEGMGAEEQAEVKKLARRVKLRLLCSVAAVLLAAAALAWMAVAACNRYYYDPNKGIAPIYGGDGQLMLDMSAFTELHSPGYDTNAAEAWRDGPGCYQVRIWQSDCFRGTQQISAERIVRGEVRTNTDYTPNTYWNFPLGNAFAARSGAVRWVDDRGGEHAGMVPGTAEWQREALEALPKSSQAAVYVTFSKDVTLEEFARMKEKWDARGISFQYAAVVSADAYLGTVVGFVPESAGVIPENTPEEEYPYFELHYYGKELAADPAKVWEAHFRSLVSYLADRSQFLTAMAAVNGIGAEYYRELLNYIDEKGVKIYGALIYGGAAETLRFLDEEKPMEFYVNDVRFSVLERK